MTRRQRAWHDAIWLVLEPLLVALLALALWARPRGSVVSPQPASPVANEPGSGP